MNIKNNKKSRSFVREIPVLQQKYTGIIRLFPHKSSLWMQNLSDTIWVSAYTVCLMVLSMFMIATNEKIRIEIATGVFLLKDPSHLTLDHSQVLQKIEETIT